MNEMIRDRVIENMSEVSARSKTLETFFPKTMLNIEKTKLTTT